MRHVIAISKRELIAYFLSPVGYVIGFAFVGLYTIFFYRGFIGATDATDALTNGAAVVGFLGIFAIPFMTMGLLADERRSGTIEMLMTAPVADWEVVLGKYLGSVIFVVCLALPSLLQIAVVRTYGMPEWGPVLSGYAGLALLVLFLVSMGLFFSAVSKSPLVAAMLSFVTFMTLLVLGVLVPDTASGISSGNLAANLLHYFFTFLRYASLSEHYENFFFGLVNTRDVVYFASGTVFFLFLSTLALESRKWK